MIDRKRWVLLRLLVLGAVCATISGYEMPFGRHSSMNKTLSESEGTTEAVRAELARLQKKSGLTLTTFYRGLSIVSFESRAETHRPEGFKSDALWGAVSRDGNKIALQLSHLGEHYVPSLGITAIDGSNLRSYLEIPAPIDICWSYDGSKLAISTQNSPPDPTLEVLDLNSGSIQYVDVRSHVTSQCFSPDDTEITYEAEHSVRIYDLGKAKSSIRVLAKGTEPTWSSDGKRIGFLDDGTYYAIGPMGNDRKTLFYRKGASSALWWSPDCSIVAYISRVGISEKAIALDAEEYRLRVWRLDDRSEDWLVDGVSAGANYQWVSGSQFLEALGETKSPSN
jgi:hypothetical protein